MNNIILFIKMLTLIKKLFSGAFTKLRKANISFLTFCLSVGLSARPHGTTRLSLEGFSLNLIFVYFSEICGDN
jgi:hypothetical protein